MRHIVAVCLATVTASGLLTAQTGVSRAKRGDTTVITTQGNGRWGPPRDAIEVLRVPESRETTFGNVARLEATPDGGVLLFDNKSLDGPQIRQFDANGKFVRNIGRSGQGPGELSFNPSFTAHTDGSVYVRNDMRSVSVFGPDGKLVSHFALNHTNGSTTEIVAAADGSIYLRAPFPRPAPGGSAFGTANLPQPMLHYDIAGKLIDSVWSSDRWLPEGAPATQYWRLLRDGRRVYTRTDKIGFMVVGPGGQPLIGEASGAAVPYLPEERTELQAAYDAFREKCERDATTPRRVVPATKAVSRGGSVVDVDGRVWIPKSTTALRIPPKTISSCNGPAGNFKADVTFEEPPAFAVFQADGSYLGEVRFPLRARVSFVGKHAWAMIPDGDDVQVLVKYRLY